MSRLSEAHGLLSGLLNTFATAQSLAVKWEGVPEDPSTATYLREWLLPGEFNGHHLGPTAPNFGPIIYQVDVVTTIKNWGIAYNISELFFNSSYFYRGRALSNAGDTTRVVIKSGRAGPAYREDTKYVLPMSVTSLLYMST